MDSFGVTLLSGGLDSTTVTAYAKKRCDHLTALTFKYGQSHSREVDCARRIAASMELEHEVLDISFLKDVAWYSALTNPQAFPIPKDTGQIGTSIPITYVPMRNTIFISLSTAYLESSVLKAIEVDGVNPTSICATLYMAPNSIDYSGYPDCRPEYFVQMMDTLRFGTKLGTEYAIQIRIETPIIHMSKAQIVEMGVELKAPLAKTWSCYESDDVPCGNCDSCVLRARGFAEANVQDPALFHLGASQTC